MIKHIAQRSAPLAALALGAGLAGCSVSYDFNEVDGVPLSEFDQSGDEFPAAEGERDGAEGDDAF